MGKLGSWEWEVGKLGSWEVGRLGSWKLEVGKVGKFKNTKYSLKWLDLKIQRIFGYSCFSLLALVPELCRRARFSLRSLSFVEGLVSRIPNFGLLTSDFQLQTTSFKPHHLTMRFGRHFMWYRGTDFIVK